MLASAEVNLIRADYDVGNPVPIDITFIDPYTHATAGPRSIDRDDAGRGVSSRAKVRIAVEDVRNPALGGPPLISEIGFPGVLTCRPIHVANSVAVYIAVAETEVP